MNLTTKYSIIRAHGERGYAEDAKPSGGDPLMGNIRASAAADTDSDRFHLTLLSWTTELNS